MTQEGVKLPTKAEIFLDAFNYIESALVKITGQAKGTPFKCLVRSARDIDPVVRRYADDLIQFSDLRNAIVHETRDFMPIADPADWTVEQIGRIRDLLEDPPRVIPMFQKKVKACKAADPVAGVVQSMAQHSFSQVPVYDGGRFAGLLTAGVIARWLGLSLQQGMSSLDGASVKEVMAFAEKPDNWHFAARDSTLFEVLDVFRKRRRKGGQLEAILLTENGEVSERLLGIITLWDLPQIYEAVEG